ncbi:hypothetical protein KJ866_01455 [Patescibacteria group bacterium]|nr:hypothetical protein [Patescibacteria group bacterium]
MGGFAFNYLRADLAEKRIGPFATEAEASTRRQGFEGFGAMCSPVFPTDEEPPVEKDNYAEQKITEFEAFFNAEMKLLEMPGISYQIVCQFLLTLLYRIKLYVIENDWGKNEDFAVIIAQKTGCPPNSYRQEVAKIISRQADHYDPLDGAVPEDIGKELKTLANQIRRSLADKKGAQDNLIASFRLYSI